MISPSELPAAPRLALAYSAPDARGQFAALFSLDQRLARATREASEPIIAQMKLAWWRDRFAEGPALWPKGEPLLEQLSGWGGRAARLGALVDGWEAVGIEGESGAARELVAGREAAWLAVAEMLDDRSAPYPVERAAARYTLASLRDEGFRLPPDLVGEAADASEPLPLPRALRPFAVLGALGERALRTGKPLLGGAPALALALRVGLTGR